LVGLFLKQSCIHHWILSTWYQPSTIQRSSSNSIGNACQIEKMFNEIAITVITLHLQLNDGVNTSLTPRRIFIGESTVHRLVKVFTYQCCPSKESFSSISNTFSTTSPYYLQYTLTCRRYYNKIVAADHTICWCLLMVMLSWFLPRRSGKFEIIFYFYSSCFISNE
jgi:hypothetical protein